MSVLYENFLSDQNAQAAYKFLNYSHLLYENDWQSIEHMHACTELFFVLNGKGFFRINQIEYPIIRGSFVIINPNTLHTEVSSETNPMEYVTFSISNLLFSRFSSKNNPYMPEEEEADHPNCYVFNFFHHSDFIENIVKKMEHEIKHQKLMYQSVCKNYLNELIVFILRETPLIGTPASEDPKQLNTAAVVKTFLRQYYSNNITLDEIAHHFYLSKFYLTHAFTAQYGISPIRYLNQVRCEKARELLLTTNFSIAAISIQIGFSSPTHFTRIYKTFYEESPSDTRRKSSRLCD